MTLGRITPARTIRSVVLALMVCLLGGAFGCNEAAAGMITVVGLDSCQAQESLTWDASGASAAESEDPVFPVAEDEEDSDQFSRFAADLPTSSNAGGSSAPGNGPVNSATSDADARVPQPGLTYVSRQRSRVIKSPPLASGQFRPPRA